MSKVLESNIMAGPIEKMDTSHVDFFANCNLELGNDPLADADEKNKFIDFDDELSILGLYRNTDLCMDVKTFLLEDRITKLGKDYKGVLTRDQEDHYQFIETLPSTAGKRNPHVYEGKYVTVTRRDDGSLRTNLKPMKVDEDFSVEGYAKGVANEIIGALKGLIGEVTQK